MTDDHDDKIFNYLSSRISSRESASIAVVGLASSSSLVFLGLIFSKDTFSWEFFSIGILFPALAFAYNEITNRGLHQDDQNIINTLIKKTDPEKWEQETKDIIINKNKRYLRRILMRYAFLSPILGWFLILPIHFELNLNDKIAWDIFFGITILIISMWRARVGQKTVL